jgi:hypothetical protein
MGCGSNPHKAPLYIVTTRFLYIHGRRHVREVLVGLSSVLATVSASRVRLWEVSGFIIVPFI